MPDVSQKVGVSFAVEGPAADDVVRLNAVISDELGSEIRFGPAGSSRPHVTIALGTADAGALTYVTGLVGEAAGTIEQFLMRFGPVAWETVTGRYVLADVVLPTSVRRWRSDLRTQIADRLIGQGRTTDDPHLTVAVVEEQSTAVDALLARADQRIADCQVTHIDVAHAGPRGAKGTIIRRLTLADA